MRVLHVTPSYFPAHRFGGPVQSVHLLNKYLVANDVQVDVLTTDAGLSHNYGDNGADWHVLDGVRVKYFNYMGYIHYNFSWSMLRSLIKAVSKYDIVHITAIWNFPVAAAAFVCQRVKRPYIISPRGTLYPETINLNSSRIKKLYFALVSRSNLNHAASIHYTTTDEQNRTHLHHHLKSKPFVIPNGIDLTEFANTAALAPFSSYSPTFPAGKYCVFLSRIDKKKGLDILLPAFALYCKQYPSVKLVIAGPDNNGYLKKVMRLVADEKIEDKVVYVGMLQGQAKIACLKDALFYVLPSYSENFGMSVAEAMMCKTPVIISKHVALAAEIVAKNAGVVVEMDVNALSEAMCSITKDEHAGKQMAQNGYDLVKEKFDADKVAKAFVQQYAITIKESIHG